MVFSIVYVSHARVPFDDAAVDELAERAARFNDEIGVTGHLSYHRGRFYQYLEGDEADVELVLERIRGDERHRIHRTAQPRQLASRRFPDWRMRYLPLAYLDEIHLEDLLDSTMSLLGAPAVDRVAVDESVDRLVDAIAARAAH